MATSLLSFSFVSLFLLACHVPSLVIASSPTAPAFVWSDHRSFGLQARGAVDYRVFSSQSLVDMVMEKFGWSSVICKSHGNEELWLDALVALIGNQLHSEDITRDPLDDATPVLSILKESFSSSKYSMALPYVLSPGERQGILHSLVSTMKGSCDLKERPGKVLLAGSCPKEAFDPKWHILTQGFEFVENAETVKDFIFSRKASRAHGDETDIILVCPASGVGLQEAESEGDALATVLTALRESETSHAVLYASDPLGATSPYRSEGRLLASNGTSTRTSTCDELCETVAGVYEGVIVAITLLIILISGLCCMMGIDTPSRFESSKDS